MKRDEHENQNQFFSSDDIPKSIYIANLPLNLNTKHIYFLFSKAGEIQSIYQHESSIIIIFARQNSVEMALFYDNFKFGPSDDEINVQALKSVDRSKFLTEKILWKEINVSKKKDKKFTGIFYLSISI